jgi:hypothetical protein
VAQLGARVNGIHEVAGSIPAWSTISNLSRSSELAKGPPYEVVVDSARVVTMWSRAAFGARPRPNADAPDKLPGLETEVLEDCMSPATGVQKNLDAGRRQSKARL